ncbi:MAG: TetR/AcrR family transcriptional regulator, partial [Candidatus Cloacimonadota bacterium]|nr:TetR/AcrR family transcriptional regulator [Candidatus Cloacimonadota bacterium]
TKVLINRLNQLFERKKMKNQLSTKEKLVFAMITCIEKYGLKNITTRKIAAEARINVAAINYHFGSKDNLLNIALEQTLNEAFVNNVEEHFTDKATYKAFLEFFEETFTGIINYPNITNAHLDNHSSPKKDQNNIANKFNNFLTDLLVKGNKNLKAQSEIEKKMSVVQILSAIIFPSLKPHLFESFLEMDFKNPQNVQMYINNLLEKNMEKI